MEQNHNVKEARKHKPVIALMVSWIIILGVYILLRIIFLVFGLHLYAAVLGGCLAVIPYVVGACYLWKSQASSKVGFYAAGIILPAISEKIILYILGAMLYGVSPANVAGLLEKIAQAEPFAYFLTNPSARYVVEISFLGLPYILGSLVLCVLLVFLMARIPKPHSSNT